MNIEFQKLPEYAQKEIDWIVAKLTPGLTPGEIQAHRDSMVRCVLRSGLNSMRWFAEYAANDRQVLPLRPGDSPDPLRICEHKTQANRCSICRVNL